MGNELFWVEFVLPVFICVVLPVLVVLIVGLVRRNETNRKAEIMLKAIENGATVDPSFFESSKKKEKRLRTRKEKLHDNLTGAAVCTAIGIALILIKVIFYLPDDDDISLMLIGGAVLLAIGIANFVIYFIGMKAFASEIEAEEKQEQIKQD